MKNKYVSIMVVAALTLVSACKKEYDTNPSAASASQVFSSTQGMTGVVVGLQGLYSTNQTSSIYNKTAITGLSDNELILLNAGNVAELQFVTGGGAVDGTNTDLAGLWATSNKIIYDADLVIANAAKLGDKNYASGLIAYATIFKAMAIGDMSMYWQQVPSGIAANVNANVTFIDRLTGYANAITAINSALSAIQANPVSSAFLANVPPGIDIVNTLHALKARYSLFSGDYTTALSEANAVDISKTSTFTFSALNQNAVYSSATATNNIFQPVDSTMGLPVPIQPALADQRVPFYISINSKIAPRFRINGFAAAATTPYPLYLPSEMTLIKAEVYAREATPDLVNALAQLNVIVTKTPASDPLGVGANLPPLTGPYTQAQILDLIYQNRCIELYMSGLKVEDMRRFNRPVSEMKRNFFPYPFTERYNNPNTPADPAF